ncbi:MAG TPA: TetR family transcriptional regulator [Usitatibacteraceae bacterium]|nr:TetR family transcriptional regulator [Usitatibacteraceae bacterium]
MRRTTATPRAEPARQPRDRRKNTRSAVGRPRKAASRPDARSQILDAAEALFSTHGFDGVTIREVTALANVDTALAHYYFATKQGLFDAVLERRAEEVFAERMAAFDRYEAEAGRNCTIEGAVAAFLAPLLQRARTGGVGWKNYFRLLSVVNNDPLHVAPSVLLYFDPLVQRLVDVLKRALPDASVADLYWCFQFLTGSLTLALSRTGRIDRLSSGLCHSDDLGAIEPRLIAYCAAGIRHVCAPPRKSAAKR